MSNMQTFNTGDGEKVRLNSLQLQGLLNLPAQNASWPTYWALRRRNLITVAAKGTSTELTARGRAVCEHYRDRASCGR